MAKPQYPDKVKLLAAVLWRKPEALHQALSLLEEQWGTLDFKGADKDFSITDYYNQEMDGIPKRTLISFKQLFASEEIGNAKQISNYIEDKLAAHNEGKRLVNIDVGYLNHNILVLASAKYAGHKIYLGNGFYADLMGRYKKGRYQPFEWTFPDFKQGCHDHELNHIRSIYLDQLRQAKKVISG